MVDTFISSKGIKVTVFIPDRTEEEQRERDREIERSLISIYKRADENTRKYLVTIIND